MSLADRYTFACFSVVMLLLFASLKRDLDKNKFSPLTEIQSMACSTMGYHNLRLSKLIKTYLENKAKTNKRKNTNEDIINAVESLIENNSSYLVSHFALGTVSTAKASTIL